ncbi:MAG: hypothetical protein JXB62_01290 [Pirellulales bacterium]|nr:hypothetical protein [Pirellulales bacterium]
MYSHTDHNVTLFTTSAKVNHSGFLQLLSGEVRTDHGTPHVANLIQVAQCPLLLLNIKTVEVAPLCEQLSGGGLSFQQVNPTLLVGTDKGLGQTHFRLILSSRPIQFLKHPPRSQSNVR